MPHLGLVSRRSLSRRSRSAASATACYPRQDVCTKASCALFDDRSSNLSVADLLPQSFPRLQDPRVVAERLYTSIKPWQTRLLLVQPGEYGSRLESTLHVAHFMEGDGLVLADQEIRVNYTALSYHWGEAIYSRPLTVNGELYSITENLFRALQRVRHLAEPVYMWTDAVCIHQHNDVERSLQVRNMLRIYQKAEQVVGWLGEHTKHSRLVIEHLRSETLSEEPVDPGSRSDTIPTSGEYPERHEWSTTPRISIQSENDEATATAEGEQPHFDGGTYGITTYSSQDDPFDLELDYERNDSGWQSDRRGQQWPSDETLETLWPRYCLTHTASLLNRLRDLLDRPWFRRVWVKQEVWASHNLRVQCGNTSIPWTTVQRLSRLAKTMHYDHVAEFSIFSLKHDAVARLGGLSVASPAARASVQMDDKPGLSAWPLYASSSKETALWEDTWNGDQAEVVTLINRTAGCQCSDPRDRIYGLLGMTPINVEDALISNPSTLSLAVDYSKHPVTVFQDLMRYLITRERGLSPLLLDATFGGEVAGRKLPSWTIDWSKAVSKTLWDVSWPIERFEHGEGLETSEDLEYRSLWKLSNLSIQYQSHAGLHPPPGNHILRLHGFRVGYVEQSMKSEAVLAWQRQYKWSAGWHQTHATSTKLWEHRQVWVEMCKDELSLKRANKAYWRRMLNREPIPTVMLNGKLINETSPWLYRRYDQSPPVEAWGSALRSVWAVPKQATQGDLLVVVEGCELPALVLRPLRGDQTFTFVGWAIMVSSLYRLWTVTPTGRDRHWLAAIMGNGSLETFDVE